MSRCTIPAVALLLLAVGPSSASPEDWPQWRGPSSLGIATGSGLPAEWSESEGVAWEAGLAGLGVSSPIVWGDRVFVTSQVGATPVAGRGSHPLLARDDRALAERETAIGGRRQQVAAEVFLVVESFSLDDGRRLFEHRTRATGDFPELHEKHNLATPTPVTDGERVYAWFGNGQIVALDMEGKLVWQRHLGEEYGTFLNNWGHGSSPALVGDLVILLCDHEPNAYLLALDARTGEERWKADRGDDRTSHSTPVAVPGANGVELIINSTERIDAYQPETGELLWHLGSWRQTPIPSPVFADGTIYLSRGYRNSDYMAIRAGGRGDVNESHIKWQASTGASYVPSIVHY